MTSDELRSWLGTLWPMAVALVFIVLAWANIKADLRLIQVDDERQWAELKRYREDLERRIDFLSATDSRREERIYSLETSDEVMTERLAIIGQNQATLMTSVSTTLAQQGEEHRNLIAILAELRQFLGPTGAGRAR